MEHENNIGASDEWYTPPELFRAINPGICFDLDPCSAGFGKDYVPAVTRFTKKDDGLFLEWNGFVWMNPPFGGRNGHVPWLGKFIRHRNGIGLCRAYTSAKWFHDYMPKMDCLLFPRGKTKFIDRNGKIGKSPGSGIVIFSIGEKGNSFLEEANLGMFWRIK